MRFSSIVGQSHLKTILTSMATKNKVSHAIMFSELSGCGALGLALAFAQYLSCPNRDEEDSCGVCPVCNRIGKLIHPDLHFSFPVNTTAAHGDKPISDTFLTYWRELFLRDPYFSEQSWYDQIELENKKGIIGVNEASSIFKKMSLKSFEGGNKYLILWLPERMNREAANKLLKLIEEPEPNTYLLFVTQTPELIMPTILSRCQQIKVPPIELPALSQKLAEENHIGIKDAETYAKIAGASLQKARELISVSVKKSESDNLIFSLINNCINKKLAQVLAISDAFSSMNKDSQRQLCIRISEVLRALYMFSLKQSQFSNIPTSEMQTYIDLAYRIDPQFYKEGVAIIDGALKDIDRNVSAKYIFTDLVNRFFLSL